jgi:hypothetical protein
MNAGSQAGLKRAPIFVGPTQAGDICTVTNHSTDWPAAERRELDR